MRSREMYGSWMKLGTRSWRFWDCASNPWADDPQRDVEENPDDWLYEFQWQLKQRQNEPGAAEPSAAASEGELAYLCRPRRRRRSAGSTVRSTGSKNASWSLAGIRTRPPTVRIFVFVQKHPEDLRQLFETALPADQSVCRGIVHLWSLDAPAPQEITGASLTTAQTMGCGTVLQLIQELARAAVASIPALCGW